MQREKIKDLCAKYPFLKDLHIVDDLDETIHVLNGMEMDEIQVRPMNAELLDLMPRATVYRTSSSKRVAQVDEDYYFLNKDGIGISGASLFEGVKMLDGKRLRQKPDQDADTVGGNLLAFITRPAQVHYIVLHRTEHPSDDTEPDRNQVTLYECHAGFDLVQWCKDERARRKRVARHTKQR